MFIILTKRLTNDIVNFEQPAPDVLILVGLFLKYHSIIFVGFQTAKSGHTVNSFTITANFVGCQKIKKIWVHV